MSSRFNLSRWAVEHPGLVLFLMVMLGAGGLVSYLGLGRSEDPSFTIKVAVVAAVWPGATAAEMQDQVADPIEKKLQELPYFAKVITYSKPSFTAMQVWFKNVTPPAELPQLYYQMRKKIADVRGELPATLQSLDINDEYGDVDSMLYMLTGEGADYVQLKRAAEAARQRLLRVPDVVKVNIYGVQDERIHVEFSQAKLATLGIPPQTLFDSLARQNAVQPAGSVETAAQRVPLRVTGALDGADAVAETPVEAAGRVFRLGDVATVTRGFEDPPRFLVRQRGKPALAVGVVMARGGNILALGDELEAAMREVLADIPVGIDVEQVADQAKVTRDAVGEFTRSFVEALVIVLVVSCLSLGLRAGMVVALSVPLVLCIVFLVMHAMGLDLHRITLGALIIALGLLVDDSIIAIEMMAVRIEQGCDRLTAATAAWTSTALPMLTGTLVTAAGFLPVGFARSSTGEYASGIFWVVTIALLASWLVAVVFTPYLGVRLLSGRPSRRHGGEDGYDSRAHALLRRLVTWCVARRGVVVLTTLAVFALSILAFTRVHQQFFPISERPELFVQIRMPEGTAISATLDAARHAEALIADDGDVATATTYVGRGAPRFWLGLNPHLPNDAFAEMVIVSRNLEARERLKRKLEAAVADGAMPDARVRIDRFNYGPPVGFPVQFRVMGSDPHAVRDLAHRVRDVMRRNAGIVEPHLDWNEQAPALRLVLDQDRLRALGLDPSDVSAMLQTLVSGRLVTTVRNGHEKVEVVARAAEAERLDLGRIGELPIRARNGATVPLTQVAAIEYRHEEAIQWRRNRETTITVRSDVADGLQAPDVTEQVWAALADIRASLPPGQRIEMGGTIEEAAEANQSIFAVFPIMVAVMLTILMVQLHSFSRVLLVWGTAPLGIIGAALSLNLSGKPFGFVALLGLIALAGMIMRNAVILVDQIEADVAVGRYSRRHAIVEATVRRARPLILTALAAILAMIPLSRSLFWGPMAVTIMGGLFVATLLTLLFLPALYALWFRHSLDIPAGDHEKSGHEKTGGPALSLAGGLGVRSEPDRRGRRSADAERDPALN